ncbi:MAG: alkaline phosphatase D family protein [Vicinamibacterales bacterium]
MARIDRRTFVRQSLAGTAGVVASTHVVFGRAPAIIQTDASLPSMPYGIAAGAAGPDRFVVWSRSDRPARMLVEYATTERFTDSKRITGPAALEGSDFTARTVLAGLPRGQRIFYRVSFQDLTDLRRISRPEVGSLVTAPSAAAPRDVSIAWSADTVGQGWGINPDWGGLRLYETMLKAEPDLFINSGDTIYADQPVVAEVKLDDGTIWKNVVTEAKSKAAQSVADFRGAYQYNLTDAHMRRFNAATAQIVQWDDHEVRDNWYPTRDLSADAKYTTKSMALIAERARQAFLEYNPVPSSADETGRVYRTVEFGSLVEVFALDLRSYRGPNSENRQPTLTEASALAGPTQIAWLTARLAASRATWKIIASDMPIGVLVSDAPGNFDAVANGDDGPASGRELELANLLAFIKTQRVRNVVWVTADIHYCAAHHYHPTRATFTEFDPFWEFVAGPLNAGTFGPNTVDATFGPEVVFTGIPPGMKPNRPPSAGFQFFGRMHIDRRTKAMTVTLHDLSGKTLFTKELAPAT